ncbi:hypothetical protein CKO51_07805 [Rhodopirellula sp. SM50]|nr:hypothetical protein CKO51_07805 [Rhodopirellula sp. SM50]
MFILELLFEVLSVVTETKQESKERPTIDGSGTQGGAMHQIFPAASARRIENINHRELLKARPGTKIQLIRNNNYPKLLFQSSLNLPGSRREDSASRTSLFAINHDAIHYNTYRLCAVHNPAAMSKSIRHVDVTAA